MVGRFGGDAAAVWRAEGSGRPIGRGFARVGPVEGAGHRGVEVRQKLTQLGFQVGDR